MPKIKGVVEKVFSKELDKPDNFDNTHKHALMVGGVWYGFGTNKQDAFVVQEDNKWQILGVGSEVVFTAEEKNGYWNAKKSTLAVIDFKKGERYNPAAAKNEAATDAVKKTYQAKKDNTGVRVGHAFNAAMLYLQTAGTKTPAHSAVLEAAYTINDVTDELKAEYQAAHPSMSEYDAGAAVGHAINNALKLGCNLKELKEKAQELLDEVIPKLTAYVRGEKPAVASAPAKKTSSKTASPAVSSVDDDDDNPY